MGVVEAQPGITQRAHPGVELLQLGHHDPVSELQ